MSIARPMRRSSWEMLTLYITVVCGLDGYHSCRKDLKSVSNIRSDVKHVVVEYLSDTRFGCLLFALRCAVEEVR